MTVLDMGAGGGYSTELMARAVGPSGKVYGQDSRDVSARAKERFEARMKTPAMKNVVRAGASVRRSAAGRACDISISSRSSFSTTTPPTWRSIAPR